MTAASVKWTTISKEGERSALVSAVSDTELTSNRAATKSLLEGLKDCFALYSSDLYSTVLRMRASVLGRQHPLGWPSRNGWWVVSRVKLTTSQPACI